jgi:NitT/TauT family transport system substrate-binding protein
MQAIHIRALRHSAFYSPLLLTICSGYLQQEGLTPVYDVATAEKTVEAGLLSGEIHLAQSAVAAGFAGLAQGKSSQIRHFAQINERDGFFLTRSGTESGGFDWADLVGQKVLVDHLFQPLAMLKYALHLLGIDFQQLQVIDAGGVVAMDEAFRAGGGRYIHQQGPYAQQLEADGVGIVVARVGEIIGPVAFSSLCAIPQWLGTDMARAYMRAYAQGQAAAIELPAEEIGRRIQSLFPGIALPVLTRTIAAYQRLGCWSRQARISEASYDKTLDIFEYAGLIRRRYPYDQLISAPPAYA